MDYEITVPVVYIGNTDVDKHIRDPGLRKKRLVAQRNTTGLASKFIVAVADNQPQKPSDNKDKVNKIEDNEAQKGHIELLQTNDAHDGAKVFSFKTPVRSKQMQKYAEHVRKQCAEDVSEDTSKSLSINQRSLRFKLCYEDSNEDDHSASDTSSDSEDNVEESDGTKHRLNQSNVNFDQITHKLQLPSKRELYFDMHSDEKDKRMLHSATSDRTLQCLKNPQMGPEEMADVLHQHENEVRHNEKKHGLETAQNSLIKQYYSFFPKWMHCFNNGFNILLYGLGSKRKLVLSFCEKMLIGQNKLVINGFFPSLSMKTILASICEDILKETTSFTGLDAQLNHIFQHYSDQKHCDQLFLIIHNIDGLPLRNSHAQNILSRLAEAPRIHILATIDHINAPLIWDQTTLSCFRWLWFDVTTYLPYNEETSYEGSLLLSGVGSGFGAHGAALALSGLLNVAKSLTSNARGVFRLLAERELCEKDDKNLEDSSLEGFSFSALYQSCREKFLVNSELTLRAHLTEFLDHKLVQIKKGPDGNEYLSVPLNENVLKEYLEQEITF